MSINADNPKPELSSRTLREAVLWIGSKVESIADIQQIEGHYKLSRPDPDKALAVSINEDAPAVVLNDEALTVIFGFSFEAHIANELSSDDSSRRSNEDADPFVYVSASFAIHYKLRQFAENETPAESELEAFAMVNSRFNLTAYWREYLNSCLVRGGLPPYFIEPFNAAQRLAELDTSSE